jgi:hypothetical protein
MAGVPTLDDVKAFQAQVAAEGYAVALATLKFQKDMNYVNAVLHAAKAGQLGG